MVNLAARVWRRLLRKRWVLALVFGLSLIYFLSSTLKHEEREYSSTWAIAAGQAISAGTPFKGSTSSRTTWGLLTNGCCNVSVPSTMQYCCDGCLANGCGSAYEHRVSCCLQPNKQLLLQRFLNRAAVAFRNLFMAVEDHFELCWAECRTSSQSVQHENTYRTPRPSTATERARPSSSLRDGRCSLGSETLLEDARHPGPDFNVPSSPGQGDKVAWGHLTVTTSCTVRGRCPPSGGTWQSSSMKRTGTSGWAQAGKNRGLSWGWCRPPWRLSSAPTPGPVACVHQAPGVHFHFDLGSALQNYLLDSFGILGKP
ncbi:hypothetical protein GHT09_019350 [Marmota monax]|uniref:SREBP regulating gene protein n=1 Tax=Marmota monax TaxID=9995 RepID=A0A834UTJ1_MARMO|nr:hypothetical protein GHT09_019350 [Marmota monax]